MSLLRFSKPARKAKTKINFPLLPDGNDDRFARGRSLYKRKLAHKLKKGINLCISYKRKLVYQGITAKRKGKEVENLSIWEVWWEKMARLKTG
jgi:hypothetical protein